MSRLQVGLAMVSVLCVGSAARAQSCVDGVCSMPPGRAAGNITGVNSWRAGSYSQLPQRPGCDAQRCSFSQACQDCQSAARGSLHVRTRFRAQGVEIRYPSTRCSSGFVDRRGQSNPWGARRWTSEADRYRAPDSNWYRTPDLYRGTNDDYQRLQYPPPDFEQPFEDHGDYDGFEGRTPPLAIEWHTDLRKAADYVRESGRPMLVNVTADWCSYCSKMKNETFRDTRFIRELTESGFVPVQIDADANRELIRRIGVQSLPTTLIVSPQLRVVETLKGFRSSQQLTQSIRRHRLQ